MTNYHGRAMRPRSADSLRKIYRQAAKVAKERGEDGIEDHGSRVMDQKCRRARRNLRSLEIRKILPQTTKLTDTKNIPQLDALITFTEKDLRSLRGTGCPAFP